MASFVKPENKASWRKPALSFLQQNQQAETPVLGAAWVVIMMSHHFRALGPHLYMFQLHSGFEQAPCELCLSEKRLSLAQNSALTVGLFVTCSEDQMPYFA